MNNKVIVFDIDGTLSDTTHRQHFVRSKPRNWQAFNAAIPFDSPHSDIVWLLNTFIKAGCWILLATGRSEDEREMTQRWLLTYNITYDRLYMRKAKDYRDDSIVKKEILDQMRQEGFEPFMVIDDRDSVVKMWRENGIRCLQVNYGNF